MKILFVHVGMPTFAKTDFDILSEVHDVRAFNFPSPQNGWGQVVKHLPALWRGVQWANLTFCWFGKLHAFFGVLFSKILGKKSTVVLSGGEVCRFSFNNGQYRSLCTRPVLKWFPKYVKHHADIILPVSNYVYHEVVESVNANIQRMKMIHHGFDTSLFKKWPDVKKERTAIIVAIVTDETLYQKRIPEVIEASKFATDVSFVLVGPDKDGTGERLRVGVPKNAKMIGGLYGADLVEQMSRAAVYVQPSAHESFGCAVAEAMACECVPVVSRIPALKEVVGDCGIYLDNPVTPQEIADKVKVALRHPELGKQARQRVIENFSLERRRKKLLKAVASL